MDNEIKFAKLRPEARIPEKRREDGGYDLYMLPVKRDIIILPGEVVMIGTGIVSAFSPKYVVLVEERGSTGTRCMSRRCGVIDSGYRGEWNIVINNTGTRGIVISPNTDEAFISPVDEMIYYPANKALAQFLIVPVPEMTVTEVSLSDILEIKSERGDGKLGSSNK